MARIWAGRIAVTQHITDRRPHGPLGGAVRPRRVVRFARLMYRRVRAFGRTYVRAACGGNLSRTCLPRTVVSEDQSIPTC